MNETEIMCEDCEIAMEETVSDETRSNGGRLFYCPKCNEETIQ